MAKLMKKKVFSNGLVVLSRTSAIIFENEGGKDEGESKFNYKFKPLEFAEFALYMEQTANECWKDVIPKEAHSMGSDYDEYYDRKYDDNGYLSIEEFEIRIVAPYWSTDTLYQFNKPKIQSFLYDLKKKMEKMY